MVKILYPIQTTFIDYPDNESLAIAICFVGCEHNCKDCHNKMMQSYDYTDGTLEVNEEDIKAFISYIERELDRNKTNKLVLTGGDPLATKNRNFTIQLLNNIADDIDVCIYTGYNIEQIKIMNLNLKKVKFIKSGKFDSENKRESYKNDYEFVLASPNQNFYDNNFKQLSLNGILKF